MGKSPSILPQHLWRGKNTKWNIQICTSFWVSMLVFWVVEKGKRWDVRNGISRWINLVKLARDLTRPIGPQNVADEEKWDPLFQGNLGWWNIIPFGQMQCWFPPTLQVGFVRCSESFKTEMWQELVDSPACHRNIWCATVDGWNLALPGMYETL